MTTVAKLFEKLNPQDGECPEWVKQLAIEFAQMHVEAALEKAKDEVSNLARTTDDLDQTSCPYDWAEYNLIGEEIDVVNETIINSYPLNNIK